MDILSICGVAVVAAVMALLLRRQSPHTSILISIGAGIVIFLSLMKTVLLTADDINGMLTASGISGEYIMILLKALGICLITEFTCDTVTEAGMLSLSTNISFAGKALVLFTALPLFRDMLSLVSAMVNQS